MEKGKIKADDGVELYYERRGSGPRSLLIIPGALTSVGTFLSPQMDYFGREGSEFTVVGFDPRGYGKSRPHKRDYLSPEILHRDARDAVQVMKALGLSKFSVLGWCEGGVIGIIAAKLFPANVQKLFAWGSIAKVTKDDVQMIEKLRDTKECNPKLWAAMEALYGDECPTLWSEWIDWFVGVHSDPVRKGDLCVKEITEVKCPTMVLHGMKDAFCPVFHAEYLEKNIKNCRLMIWPEGKHNLHFQFPINFNKLVHDFLIE